MVDLTDEALRAANDRLLQRRAEIAKDGPTSREIRPARTGVDDVVLRVIAKAKSRPEFGRPDSWCGCRFDGNGKVQQVCDTHDEEKIRQRAERARADREANAEKLMFEAGVMREHSTAKLEDFPESIRTAALAWLDGPQERCGLLVKGPTGTGKTRLAAALVRPWVIDGGRAWMTQAGDLFARIRSTFGEKATDTEERLVGELKSVGLLVIDDLGNEGTVTPFITATLHRVLSARNGDFKATIVTTNLKARELAEVYGGPIASRIGTWDQLVVAGEDRRKRA